MTGQEFLDLVADYQNIYNVDVFGEFIENENGESELEVDEKFYEGFVENYPDYDFEKCVKNMLETILNKMEEMEEFEEDQED